jgi:hypothetical protein
MPRLGRETLFEPDPERVERSETAVNTPVIEGSAKISRAKALAKFSRCRAAQDAALEENWI